MKYTGKSKVSKQPPVVEVRKPSVKVCSLCSQRKLASASNDLEAAGKFYKFGDLYFHYFCLLFR